MKGNKGEKPAGRSLGNTYDFCKRSKRKRFGSDEVNSMAPCADVNRDMSLFLVLSSWLCFDPVIRTVQIRSQPSMAASVLNYDFGRNPLSRLCFFFVSDSGGSTARTTSPDVNPG